MTTTFTDTYNRDDIRRVHASFAADYTIVAEWTGLRLPSYVAADIAAVKALTEAQYLREVHIQLVSASGAIRQAAAYRVSTNASGWSTNRPGDLYWDSESGDWLRLVVFYNANWAALSKPEQDGFRELHLPGWGPSDFNGNYGAMSSVADRRYASRAYGMERTRYSS
jgi:Bacterial HORMA domain family 1